MIEVCFDLYRFSLRLFYQRWTVYMIAHDVIFQSSNCIVTSRPLHQYTLITTDIILLLSLLFIIITIQIHNRLNEVQVYRKDKEPMHSNQMILGFGLTNIQRFCEKEVSEYVQSSTTVEEKKHTLLTAAESITKTTYCPYFIKLIVHSIDRNHLRLKRDWNIVW